MKFCELDAADVERWGGFLQSKAMLERYRQIGREVYLVGVKGDDEDEGMTAGVKSEKGEVLGFGVMTARGWRMGKKIFRVAGGWVLDYEGREMAGVAEILKVLTRGAREFVRRRGGMMIEIAPEVVASWRDNENQVLRENPKAGELRGALEGLGYKYLGEYEQVKWIYTLDLKGKTEADVLAGMRQSHRRMLRKAEREGVRVRELRDEELPILKQVIAETGERQGFGDQTLEYYCSMKAVFGQDVKFMVAERAGVAVAASSGGAKSGGAEVLAGSAAGDDGKKAEVLVVGMFVRDGKEMIYLYGGSRKEGQKYGGSYALQWEMIREALREGAERYNFYGVRPVAGDGVYQFKQGFRGGIEEKIGTFALPIGAIGKAYVARIKPREFGSIR